MGSWKWTQGLADPAFGEDKSRTVIAQEHPSGAGILLSLDVPSGDESTSWAVLLPYEAAGSLGGWLLEQDKARQSRPSAPASGELP